MKRLSIVGLMLASAFALTNCSQEIVPPIQENDVIVDESIKEDTTPEEVVSIPFEVYANSAADEAETKTTNAGNNTKWAVGDDINVYHSVHNANDYVNNHAFVIADTEKGLFGGGLKSSLTEETYDWCFLYPYDEIRGNTLTDVVVKIGVDEEGNYIQPQLVANSKAHVAGIGYPMFGTTKNQYPDGIPANENPKVKMKHLSAMVAIKLVNETGNDITINQIELESATHPIIGKFNVDLTEDIPVFSVTSDGDDNNENNEYSNSVVLKGGTEGVVISKAEGDKESFSKFYMAVAPVTDKFTIRINGTTITRDLEIPLESGKVTTIKIKIPRLQGTLSSAITKDGKSFVNWGDKTSVNKATINGATNIDLYTVNNGTIVISGGISDFLGRQAGGGVLPLSFFASSKVKIINDGSVEESAAKLSLKSIYVNVIDVADVTIEGSALDESIGINVTFNPVLLGNFNLNNIIVLNEELAYYSIDEAKADYLIQDGLANSDKFKNRTINKDIKATDFNVALFRSAMFSMSQPAWEKLYKLAQVMAPGQFSDYNDKKEDTPLGALLRGCAQGGLKGVGYRGLVAVAVSMATMEVTLDTSGEVAMWGMNINGGQ